MAARNDERVVLGARSIGDVPGGSVVTLGTFDGVHLGHRALVARARSEADALGLPLFGHTFSPLPSRVLAPDRAPRPLISTPERARRLLLAGVDRVVVEPFDLALAALDPEDFVRDLLMRLSPRHVVVGFNFKFGRDRRGSPQALTAAGRALGFSTDVVPAFELDGLPVSSSRIRGLLEDGDASGAARLLGAPHELFGPVVEGDRRGRLVGVPTANLAPGEELVPRAGVYATVTTLPDGARLPSVTNVGMRPTFGGQELRVETHVLGFEGDLYTKWIRVALVDRIRDERRFDGLEALVAQIRDDMARARAILHRMGLVSSTP
ncbi:MAG: riboflavin biosynthesis protein RibF [Deltaproteobacteria bacterium]|nr:riboflavin biosynthesis protein RibF [Deltaproteobacteria bacterium]